jgi:phosphoglucomutase
VGVYVERFEGDPAKHGLHTQQALADVVALARELARIGEHTGRGAPDVVT